MQRRLVGCAFKLNEEEEIFDVGIARISITANRVLICRSFVRTLGAEHFAYDLPLGSKVVHRDIQHR